jgi:hypothetical protein
VQKKLGFRQVRVAVKVLDPLGIERAGAPHDPVHLVPLLLEQVRQVRAVLAGDAGDEGLSWSGIHHESP